MGPRAPRLARHYPSVSVVRTPSATLLTTCARTLAVFGAGAVAAPLAAHADGPCPEEHGALEERDEDEDEDEDEQKKE